MPQFCILFYANYTILATQRGGPWPNAPLYTPLNPSHKWPPLMGIHRSPLTTGRVGGFTILLRIKRTGGANTVAAGEGTALQVHVTFKTPLSTGMLEDE